MNMNMCVCATYYVIRLNALPRIKQVKIIRVGCIQRILCAWKRYFSMVRTGFEVSTRKISLWLIPRRHHRNHRSYSRFWPIWGSWRERQMEGIQLSVAPGCHVQRLCPLVVTSMEAPLGFATSRSQLDKHEHPVPWLLYTPQIGPPEWIDPIPNKVQESREVFNIQLNLIKSY